MSLTNKVAQFDADSDLVNAWVHGPASGAGSTVTTDSGTVRTPAKLIADNEAELQAVIDLTAGWANGKTTTTAIMGGMPVASPAKLIADKEAQINADAVGVLALSTVQADISINQASIATTQADLAITAKTAAEIAASNALISAGSYTTEALGRAAVIDGVAFKVQGSAGVAAYEYRRINSATSVLIATYPSTTAVSRNGYVVNGELTKKEYDVATSEWVISHPLFRIELGSGRSFVAVAAVTDLRIPLNRTYYVDLTDAATGSTLTGQLTPTDWLSASYGVGAFVDDLRLPLFTHRATGGNRGHGGLLSQNFVPEDLLGKVGLAQLTPTYAQTRQYPAAGKTWFTALTGTKVTYDPTTRTLAWDGEIFTPVLIGTSTRVKLAAGSIVIPILPFQVVYLDLTRAATTQTNSPADAIRVGRYQDTSGEQFTGEPHQVPIFYRRNAGEHGACPGFIPVSILGAPTTAASSRNVQFSKASATEASIYIKGSGPNNWLEYIFKRTVVAYDAGVTANSQSDHWRLHYVYETDADFTRLYDGTDIISSGEWECALREAGGKPDSIGGYHGDELQTNSFFLIDGMHYAQTAIVSTACDEIQFVQESVIYSCNTQNPICKHVKRYRIAATGIELTQDFEWLTVTTLTDAWIAMLPIKRNINVTTGALITDRGIRYPGYAVEDLSIYGTGELRVYTPAKPGDSMHLYGTTTGISAEVILLETPGLPNADFHFSDASVYNKVYFNAKGAAADAPDYTTAIGEKWRQKTLYKITTCN